MSKKPFNTAAPKKLSDDELLDLVQKQTLKYFFDFAHPACGLARERSNVVTNYHYDLDCVTTGGTGFGIMALVAGAERGFLDKGDVLAQLEKIVEFLERADRFHGAFPHFLDGNSGKTIPFSPKDDGGDLVETSFLMMGLLTARQYFANIPTAAVLNDKITALWEAVEWDWYTKGEKKLYWHWSENHGFDMNLPIRGWNECLITHVLAAASPTHPVSPDVYTQSWLTGGDFKNGKDYNGTTLPLGPDHGGPLFFSHYSFLGLDPRNLKDGHADYWEQNRAHTMINRDHCVRNPNGHAGYSAKCWGLTASDTPNGYNAHSPNNDNGTITPTAALSAFPYTSKESMEALRHFYEDLGDRIFGDYGFVDAFHTGKNWQAPGHLAIDQGPIVVMIENHRSGLLWELFMRNPEIAPALQSMGFDDPVQAALKPKTPRPPSA